MIHGVINVYKEQGFTSHDVVAKLRGIVGQKKIGHTGTLDPDAVGVLPVCLGRATKLCDMLTDKDKVYEAVMLLGVETDTQDTTGQILKSSETDELTEEQVRAAVLDFVGDYNQVPPMYSALKINGKKLYELAREGKTVERAARRVQIFDIEILSIALPRVTMKVHCSKGTYIRTLCHDIGQALSCGGCMASLRRTMAAGYTLDESHTLEQVQAQGEALLRPVDTLFRQHPAYHITHPRVEQLCRNGNAFTVKTPLDGGIYRVYGTEGDFLCLSRLENGQMTSIKNFFGA